MTEVSSCRSEMSLNFDTYKNEEWLRRRKLRIEQVRRQSKGIAKALREKAALEGKIKAYALEKVNEIKFKCWKAEKLNEMERKLRCALEEFGTGYKLAEAEPNVEEITEMKNKLNFVKAQERGQIAKQEELLKKKLEKAKRTLPIQRKKMTRKIEDLRSALIRSVPAKKELFTVREEQEKVPETLLRVKEPEKTAKTMEKATEPSKEQMKNNFCQKKGAMKNFNEKKSLQSILEEDGDSIKKEQSKCKISGSEAFITRHPTVENVWINLNNFKTPSGSDSGIKTRRSVKSVSEQMSGHIERGKNDTVVEFYDHPSRYYCRTYRNFDNLVERIDPESEPNANELAKEEEENEILEAIKKQQADLVRQERGNEALKRERINRNYTELISKLEDLHKKEKIIKAQQRSQSCVIHMTDERLMERMKMKQRIMDAKFEGIFYEATAGVPYIGPLPEMHVEGIHDRTRAITGGSGDCYNISGERIPTKLSFSPRNLKTNSPITPCGSRRESPVQARVEEEGLVKATKDNTMKKKKKKKKKEDLLLEIDKTLKEGRTLRESVSWSQRSSQTEISKNCDEVSEGSPVKVDDLLDENTENENKAKHQDQEYPKINVLQMKANELRSENKGSESERKLQDQECQTEDLIIDVGDDARKREKSLKIEVDHIAEDYPVPPSNTTSYKSPPSVITSSRLRQFIDYLGGFSSKGLSEIDEESERGFDIINNPKFKRKVQTILYDLLNDKTPGDSGPKKGSSRKKNPVLDFYIQKLLSVSREYVANLSVTSDNVSTPNVTDLDVQEESEIGSEYPCERRGHELFRELGMKRADELDKTIKNWKTILGKQKQSKTRIMEEDEPEEFNYDENDDLNHSVTSDEDESDRSIWNCSQKELNNKILRSKPEESKKFEEPVVVPLCSRRTGIEILRKSDLKLPEYSNSDRDKFFREEIEEILGRDSPEVEDDGKSSILEFVSSCSPEEKSKKMEGFSQFDNHFEELGKEILLQEERDINQKPVNKDSALLLKSKPEIVPSNNQNMVRNLNEGSTDYDYSPLRGKKSFEKENEQVHRKESLEVEENLKTELQRRIKMRWGSEDLNHQLLEHYKYFWEGNGKFEIQVQSGLDALEVAEDPILAFTRKPQEGMFWNSNEPDYPHPEFNNFLQEEREQPDLNETPEDGHYKLKDASLSLRTSDKYEETARTGSKDSLLELDRNFNVETEPANREESCEDNETERNEIEKPEVITFKGSEAKIKYDNLTKKCSKRISELSDLLNEVRRDKEKLLNSTSGSSRLSKNGKVTEEDVYGRPEEVSERIAEEFLSSKAKSNFQSRYKLSKAAEDPSSILALADSVSNKSNSASTSWETLPDVVNELLKKEILTSPFKWSDGEYSAELTTINDNISKPSSIESAIGKFRREMSKIKPVFSSERKVRRMGSLEEVMNDTTKTSGAGFVHPEFYEELFVEEKIPESEDPHSLECKSSTESINKALSNLGLNWAKSFLKKTKQSKERSYDSSSSSETDSETGFGSIPSCNSGSSVGSVSSVDTSSESDSS